MQGNDSSTWQFSVSFPRMRESPVKSNYFAQRITTIPGAGARNTRPAGHGLAVERHLRLRSRDRGRVPSRSGLLLRAGHEEGQGEVRPGVDRDSAEKGRPPPDHIHAVRSDSSPRQREEADSRERIQVRRNTQNHGLREYPGRRAGPEVVFANHEG